jgi:mono/diheme cytochrome c family protein
VTATAWQWGLAAALAAAVAGCGSPRRSEPIAGSMPLQEQRLQNGKALYDRYCYRCHLGGEGGLAPSINDKPLPKFLMRFQVRRGLGAMPSFSPEVIDDRELEEILDYLVALRHHGR